MAGTLNFKPKYASAFPTVRLVSAQPGRLVSVGELEALGVLAPEAAPISCPELQARSRRPARSWPSYERCLEGAPLGPGGNPQRTSVDFTWCMMSLSWGHTVEATAGRLLEVSTKAAENGEAYALKTAENAAWTVRHR